MTSDEIQKAEAIVREWFWQPDSWHRKSILRYYESAPIQPDVLQLVIAYLKQQETDSLFILNKELQLGEAWKATDAWFQTSPSDKWAGTESTKIRIYQAFKPKADESDGPYTVENGCKYLVTHEFHWDVAEVPALPASSSGVNYTLQGVTRDKETGLYSCVIEKRETVQQDVDEYVGAETIFERKKFEQHLGVKQQNVSGTGKQASAGGGTLVERRVSKNPDCTSDVENETTVEKPVQNAVVKVEKTWEGTIRTTKHVNQPGPSSTIPAKPGSSVTNEKKPGGYYDHTVVEADETPLGVKGRTCSKTIFEHVDEEVENVPNDPGQQHGSAGGGTRVEFSSSMTRFGTWDKKQITYVEQPVQNAVKEFRKTVQGTVVTTTDRNQPSPLNGSGLKVGETRRSEKTRGGLYDNTTSLVEDEPAGLIRKSCDRVTSVHTDEETNNVKEKPSSVEQTAEVNKRKTKLIRQTDAATWDETEQVTTWEPTQHTETWSDAYSTHTHCTYRNQPHPLKPTGGDRVICSFAQNDHGSYDGSYTVTSGRDAFGGGLPMWSKPFTVNKKVYLQKPGGKLVCRTVTAEGKAVYGYVNNVIDEVSDGESCEFAGLKSDYRLAGRDFAYGEKYWNITVGQETEVK